MVNEQCISRDIPCRSDPSVVPKENRTLKIDLFAVHDGFLFVQNYNYSFFFTRRECRMSVDAPNKNNCFYYNEETRKIRKIQ